MLTHLRFLVNEQATLDKAYYVYYYLDSYLNI